jgi:hypothetical protein
MGNDGNVSTSLITVPDAGSNPPPPPVACNTLAMDTTPIHLSCSSCPGCPTSGNPALANGTYALTKLEVLNQDCSSFNGQTFSGKMQIMGNQLDMVISQPGEAIGDTTVSRMTYVVTQNGSSLNVQVTCPVQDGGISTEGVNYFSDGKSIRLSILPGVVGDSVFTKQ